MAKRDFLRTQSLLRLTASSLLSSILAPALVGCAGKTVDLGSNGNPTSDDGPIYSTGIPTASSDASAPATATFRVVDAEADPCTTSFGATTLDNSILLQLGTHAGRLYWLSVSSTAPGASPAYYLRSCNANNCATSLVGSAPIQNDLALQCGSGGTPSNDMQFDAEFAYWTDIQGYQTRRTSTAPNAQNTTAITSSSSFVVDHGTIYVSTSDNTIFACDPTNCSDTSRRFRMSPPASGEFYHSGVLFGQDAEYLYLVEGTSGLELNFIRVKKDDSQPFEVLFTTPFQVTGMQVFGDYLYWVEPIALGRVLRCLKSGCLSSATVVAEGFNHPAALAVDDQSVYVLERPEISWKYTNGHSQANIERPGRILTCPLAGCSSVEVFYTSSDDTALQTLAVDERFVYLAGSSCFTDDLGPNSTYPRCHHITAIPK